QPGLPHCPGCRGLSPASCGGGLPGTGPPGAQAVHRHQRCGLRPAQPPAGQCVRRSHHGRLYFRGRRSL
ncbi:hypothetical protein AJOOGB_AJOOGB_15530, partial [Dysosmobacter welbionis]